MSPFDRRRFLELAAGTAGALAGARAFAAHPAPLAPERKTKHVVLVAFAGGVRTRETFGSPENIPTLKALADEGVLYTRARTANLGHFGAALSIVTGISEQRGIRDNARGLDPTLFEYLRKDLALPANDVWIATSGGTQQMNYSYGLHPEYGERFGANTLDGDGVFNKEFKRVLGTLGQLREMPKAEADALQRLRRTLAANDKAGLNTVETAAQVERYILEELLRGTADLTGANVGDAKALRVARNLLSLFRPKLTAAFLQDADIAHGSFNGYVEVIRRNDAALGELVKAVREDPDLAASTAIIVAPEFGRDRDLNSRRGLDHGDGSDDIGQVTCVCWGPDFKRGLVVKEEVQVVDIVPTVCDLFGARARYAHGRKLPGLYA